MSCVLSAFATTLLIAAASHATAAPPGAFGRPPCLSCGETATDGSVGDPSTGLLWNLESHRHLAIQLPGMSHHFSRPRNRHGRLLPHRRYNEHNWGVGMQFEQALSAPWDRWVAKRSAGLLKDSLGGMGLYAGVSAQKRVLDDAGLRVEVGGGAFAFYRTLEFDGPHLLVPAALPVVSLLHKPTQFGINGLAVPQFRINGRVMPGVVFIQFTRAF